MDEKDTKLDVSINKLLVKLKLSKEKLIEEFDNYDETFSKNIVVNILMNLAYHIKANNLESFKQSSSLLTTIWETQDHSKWWDYLNCDENPFLYSNAIILASKYDRVKILELLFQKPYHIIYALSNNERKNFPEPCDKDDESHNAFYYAIRSGKVQLLETLIKKWPENYFEDNCKEVDILLSRACKELELRNIDISLEMTTFLYEFLLDLRHFNSDNLETNMHYRHGDIIKRILQTLNQIETLREEIAKKESDERIVLLTKYVIQNLFILKRWLKLTYNRIPWEEMEYFLSIFLRFLKKKLNNEDFFITKKDILKYLNCFLECLENETKNVREISLKKLSKLPPLGRDVVVENITKAYPCFEEFYRFYELMRDCNSLVTIKKYVDLTENVNPLNKDDQIIIIRSLQVIGENLKNTFESPKLSKETSDFLVSLLPIDTNKIIIRLRNSFSHKFSISKIRKNFSSEFYINLKNDIRSLNQGITLVLSRKRFQLIRNFLVKVTNLNDDILTESFVIFNIFDLKDKIPLECPTSSDTIEVEKLISELNARIKDKTFIEKKLFLKLTDIIVEEKNKFKKCEENYSKLKAVFSSLPFCTLFFGLESLSFMKKSLKNVLSEIAPLEEKQNLKYIGFLTKKLFIIANERSTKSNQHEIDKLFCKIFYITQVKISEIKYLEEMKNSEKKFKLSSDECEKDFLSLISSENFSGQDILELKNILDDILSSFNSENSFQAYQNNFTLQVKVNMLVLSILSCLSDSSSFLSDNKFFLDDDFPILVGKNLRNHLAHYNEVVNTVLNCELYIFLYAKRIVKTEKWFSRGEKLHKYQKTPSNICSDSDALSTVNKQLNLYSSLSHDNLRIVIQCIKDGADINGKNNNFMSSLHFAVKSNTTENLKFLLKNGLNFAVKDVHQQNLLHTASYYGKKEIIDLLLDELGLPLEEEDDYLQTPLHIAAQNGCIDAVESLLNHNARTDTTNIVFRFPVQEALYNNHMDVINLLLRNVKNVDDIQPMGGFTLLHCAAEIGNLKMVKHFLAKGANINALTDQQVTPLHLSALKGHIDVVETLIVNGANLNIKSVNNITPLHNAAEKGHYNIIKLLLKFGAEIEVYNDVGHSPLHVAICEGHLKIVKTFVKNKAFIEKTDIDNNSVLHLAVIEGIIDIVNFFLENKVCIDVKNVNGFTPLQLSIILNHNDISKRLIECGANINVVSKQGATPFKLAIMKGNFEIVNYLLLKGVKNFFLLKNGQTILHECALISSDVFLPILEENDDKAENLNEKIFYSNMLKVFKSLVKEKFYIDCKNYLEQTPLHLACSSGNNQIVEFLINLSVDINTQDIFGYTPLHYAVESKDLDTVKLLLERSNGKINEKNFSGNTALCLAVKNNYVTILRLLMQHGADINIGYPLKISISNGFYNITEILLQEDNINVYDSSYGDKTTLLQIASTNGDKKGVKCLLSKKCLISDKKFCEDIEKSLFISTIYGHDEVVFSLLSHVIDINKMYDEGYSLLHIAAKEGNSKIIKMLLDEGAFHDILDKEGRSPIEIAVSHNNLNAVKMICDKIKLNVNAPIKNNSTLLHIAVENGHLDMVKFLITFGARANEMNRSGSKPIHVAAYKGYQDILQYFLDCNISLLERGSKNTTLLHYAIKGGHQNITEYLLKNGLDVNLYDDTGRRAIHYACLQGNKDILKVLLNFGAFYNCIDNFNNTPLKEATDESIKIILNLIENMFKAIKCNNVSDLEICIKKGVLINTNSSDSETPLLFATRKGYLEIINVLIKNKANPNIKGKDGFTPLHVASKKGSLEIVKILLKHGAIYDALTATKKIPVEYARNKDVIKLLKLVSDSFRDIKNSDCAVLHKLKQVRDCDLVEAIMNARNKENETLIVHAIRNDFPEVKQLQSIFFKESDINKVLLNELVAREMYDSTLDVLERLFESKKQTLGPDHPATLETEEEIANVLYKMQKYPNALTIFKKICDKREEMFGSNNKETLKVRAKIGLILHRQGYNQEALGILEDVCRKLSENFGSDSIEIIDTLTNMGLVLNALRRHEDALKINKNALDVFLKKFDSLHPKALVLENNIAQTLANLQRLDEAKDCYEKVYEARKQVLGPLHSDTLRTFHNLQIILEGKKKYGEALKGLKKLLFIQKRVLGPHNIDTLNTECQIGIILFKEFKFLEALKIFRENLEKQKKILGTNHPEVKKIEMFIQFIHSRYEFEGSQGASALKNVDKFYELERTQSNGNMSGEISNILAEDSEGRTALHFAVSEGNLTKIKTLLESEIDFMHVSKKGNTVLHIASLKGYAEVSQLLLNYVKENHISKLKDFVNRKTYKNGNSALHAASNVETSLVLLKYGAIYNLKNKADETPLDLAKNIEIKNILNLIKEMFENAANGKEKIIYRFNKLSKDVKKAVINARNEQYHTVLQVSVKSNHKMISDELCKQIMVSLL